MNTFNMDDELEPQLTLDLIRLIAMTRFAPLSGQDSMAFAGAPVGALQAEVDGAELLGLIQRILRQAMGTTSPVGFGGVKVIIGSGVVEFHGVLGASMVGTPFNLTLRLDGEYC